MRSDWIRSCNALHSSHTIRSLQTWTPSWTRTGTGTQMLTETETRNQTANQTEILTETMTKTQILIETENQTEIGIQTVTVSESWHSTVTGTWTCDWTSALARAGDVWSRCPSALVNPNRTLRKSPNPPPPLRASCGAPHAPPGQQRAHGCEKKKPRDQGW